MQIVSVICFSDVTHFSFRWLRQKNRWRQPFEISYDDTSDTRSHINSVGGVHKVTKSGCAKNITVIVRLIDVGTTRNLKFSTSSSIKKHQ